MNFYKEYPGIKCFVSGYFFLPLAQIDKRIVVTTFELNSRRESILQQMAELLNNEEAITKAERWIKRMYHFQVETYPLLLNKKALRKEIEEAEEDIVHNRYISHEDLLKEIHGRKENNQNPMDSKSSKET